MKKILVILSLTLFAMVTFAQQTDLTSINQILQRKHYDMMSERDLLEEDIEG